MGIDWGEKKCGTALADEETKLAFAWKIFSTNKFEEELVKNSADFSFFQIVLGISADYQFSQKNKEKILAFRRKLEKKGWKVFFQEEFFSTKLAKNNLRETGKTNKEDDAEAARIILQSWLDKKK